MYFESSNLHFRKLSKAEISDLLWLKREDWTNTHHVSIINEDDQNKWFESIDDHPHSPRNLMLIASEWPGRDDVGIYKISNIDWVNRSADVGWSVYESRRNKGFGKKLVAGGSSFCFEILNLHRLNCEILADNTISQKCAVFAGFVAEGVKREAVHRFGSSIDSYVFGMIRKDFYDEKTATLTESSN